MTRRRPDRRRPSRRALQLELPAIVPELPSTVRAALRAAVVEDWAKDAACTSQFVDPDWWTAPDRDPDQDTARTVCQSCPVRRSCLAHALVTAEQDGIWGGASPDERVWMRLFPAAGAPVPVVLDQDFSAVA